MSRRKPPLEFRRLCCPSLEYVVDRGVLEAHTVTYKSGDFVEVETLIGFRASARYLHLRKNQHIFECPFCGTSLQTVVKVAVHDLGQEYGIEAPISLAGNPRTGEARFTYEAMYQAIEALLARQLAARKGWETRRARRAQSPDLST